MSVTDRRIRERALDTASSCIVQAPAGSGKTELLTQRFLKLLATVDRPERVLAITFTRKATQEMRERIMLRLRQAASGIKPEASHERQAVEFAARVLSRSRALDWEIAVNPGRLQIHTIDGLCARISGRTFLPGAGMGGMLIMEDARPLYHGAARRLIEDGGKQDSQAALFDALSNVLVYLKGSATSLEDLLVSMLGRREQWLGVLGVRPADMSVVLAVQQQLELQNLKTALGEESLQSLVRSLELMARKSGDIETAAGLISAIEASSLDPADWQLQVKSTWRALKAVSTAGNEPFAPRSVKSKVLPAQDEPLLAEIENVQSILAAWKEPQRALAAFRRFVANPPFAPDPATLSVLADLQLLLKYATAELRVLFAEKGRSDFIYVAELALQALGDELSPGEALLQEDLALQHILLDEFQDTSHTQYQLVNRLVSGWQQGDGRSLFLVGDPMQSIYRFRKADVALFNQVFANGVFGDIKLETLRLSSNFRSRPEIIDWVNEQFPGVFREPDHFAPNFVAYSAVESQRKPGGRVHAHPFSAEIGPAGEAELIASLIEQTNARRPGMDIAVLARTRVQLETVARALQQRAIPFEAVQVEALRERQVILDLGMLLRAIMHPADRIAWLALLRAPWCSLNPLELLAVAGSSEEDEIFARIADPRVISSLSSEKKKRLARLHEAMSMACMARKSSGYSRLVEAAWLHLAGPCAATGRDELDNATQFFNLLEQVENDLPDDILAALDERMESFYSESEAANVRLMTIHKAKGLEFDVVIVPGLQRARFRADIPLMRIQELRTGAMDGVLMAPRKHKEANNPGLYDYLGLLESEQEAFELCRLLYVAVTRARSELHLFGGWGWQKRPQQPSCSKGSFLELLWPFFESRITDAAAPQENPVQAGAPVLLPRLYLVDEPASALETGRPEAPVDTPELRIPGPDRVALGQAFHSWMQLIHDHWSQGWTAEWFTMHRPALESTLRNAGAGPGNLSKLTDQLTGMIVSTLDDPEGLSLLSPEYKNASWAELQFISRKAVNLQRHIIDRLYEDNTGRFFIVDYKTGTGGGSSETAWQAQLQRYAEVLENFSGDRDAETRIHHVPIPPEK